MEFRFLSAQLDRDEWDALFDRLPFARRDVHFSSAYARAQDVDGAALSILAVLTIGDRFVMQPFAIRPVAFGPQFAGVRDMTSLYGFGGPVSNEDGPLPLFQDALRSWAKETSVVCEHCCYHPLQWIEQAELLGGGDVTKFAWSAKPVVVINLETFSEETLRRNVRRGIKAAEAAGIVVDASTNRFIFTLLYDLAMERKKASARWLHGFDYWRAHDEDVGARWYFSFDKVAMLCHRGLLTIGIGEVAYAHFLGSDGERDGLDEQLYFMVALDLKAAGFRRFHLGGGLTDAEDDSLLRFKRGFSKETFQAVRYGRIFDRELYDALEAAKAQEEVEVHGRVSTRNWFPSYRREFA